jgi:hypothetical protein
VAAGATEQGLWFRFKPVVCAWCFNLQRGPMTRRSTRIVWGFLGICLVAGLGLSLAMIYGPPEWARSRRLHDLGAIVDIVALLFWMLVFGIYWASKDDPKA